jgi:S-adenosylmethionine:tRNA ribosyltransferase-isomerase
MKVADGLLTGFHEPRASHLNMLQSLAGFEHIESAYQAAIQAEYYWHQFGDLHLILP